MPSLACNSSRTRQPALAFPTDTPTQSPVLSSATMEPAMTATSGSLLAPEIPPTTFASPTVAVAPTQTATPQPYCTVLVNVRLRSGPGVDFDHLTTLYVNEMLVPFAYVPQGRTDGAWVKIYLANNPKRVGWVIASTNAIACNLDITLLPPP